MKSQVFALVKKEALLLLRDKHATAVLFLMPVIFIFILSVALQDVFADKSSAKVSVAVTGEGQGKELANEISEKLKTSSQIEIVENPDLAKATLFVSEKAAKEFRKTAEKPDHALKVKFDPALGASYRWFVKVSISNVLYQMMFEKKEKVRTDSSVENPLGFLNEDTKRKSEAVLLSDFIQEENTPGKIIPTSLQQNVPGWALFAMFFIAIPLASGILKERQDGTIKRLLTLPVKKSTLILGKLIPYIGVNILQFAFMLAVGLYVIPLVTDLKFQLGSNSVNLIWVTLVCAIASTSYGIFISCVSKSIEHASALSAGIVICMAALGGIMVPLFAMPPFMQNLAKISPLYWGHQAYLDVLVREVSLGVIAPKLLVLLVFAAVLLTIGRKKFQWL